MRVLIVGHGRMGRFHAQTVRNAGDQAVTLDPYAEADHWTWLHVGDEYDAAIIACPIDQLHIQAIQAHRRGITRLLVEKPGAATLIDAQALEHFDPTIAVGYIERLNPVVAELATQAPSPGHVTFHRQGPGMAALGLDVAAHDIDLHRLYFPDADATIQAERSLMRRRTITTSTGYTADLLTRTLHAPDGTVTRCHQHDLLAEQWERFKTGKPAATISDAIAVHRILADHHQLQQPAVQPIAA